MDEEAKVLVFRNGAGEPIAVPEEIVTAGERAYRCYKMRQEGASWAEIAMAEQYPSATSAYAEVHRYLEEAKALVVESSQREMLTLEVARFDSLQHAFWKKADAGNVAAGALIVSIIMNRAKLAEALAHIGAGAGRTVVVSAADGAYTNALQQAANTDTQFENDQEQDSGSPGPTVEP